MTSDKPVIHIIDDANSEVTIGNYLMLTIESILKTVHKYSDYKYNNLFLTEIDFSKEPPEEIIRLAQYIKSQPQLIKINLTYSNFTGITDLELIRPLFEAIFTHPNIRILDLAVCKLGRNLPIFAMIAEYIAQSNIIELSLNLNRFNKDDCDPSFLDSVTLILSNPYLRKLKLDRLRPGRANADQLAIFITALAECQELQYLDFQENALDELPIPLFEALGKTLANLQNLRHLSLAGCQMGKIVTREGDGKFGITVQFIYDFIMAILELKYLTSLDLSHNLLGQFLCDDIIDLMVKIQQQHTLEYINLNGNAFSIVQEFQPQFLGLFVEQIRQSAFPQEIRICLNNGFTHEEILQLEAAINDPERLAKKPESTTPLDNKENDSNSDGVNWQFFREPKQITQSAAAQAAASSSCASVAVSQDVAAETIADAARTSSTASSSPTFPH